MDYRCNMEDEILKLWSCGVHIQATGVCTPTTDHPIVLLANVTNDILAGKPNPLIVLTPQQSGIEPSPIIQAAVNELRELPLTARLLQIANQAFANVVMAINPEDKIFIQINLPPSDTWRAQQLDTHWLQQEIMANYPMLKFANWNWQSTTLAGADNLVRILPKLDQVDQIIFGGIDSLIDNETCAELGEYVQTQAQPDGLIPAEGAGFLLFNKTSGKYQMTSITITEEKHHKQAKNHPVHGLKNAICNCNAVNIAEIDAIIPPINGTIEAELEWYQTTSALWQNKAMPTELRMQPALGFMGAAELPIALILACAKLDYPFPAINNITICERPDNHYRAAITITKS